jgi:hypothetical protein
MASQPCQTIICIANQIDPLPQRERMKAGDSIRPSSHRLQTVGHKGVDQLGYGHTSLASYTSRRRFKSVSTLRATESKMNGDHD